MAEREGFEPPVPRTGTADFESAAFDLSAISPPGLTVKIILHPWESVITAAGPLLCYRLAKECREPATTLAYEVFTTRVFARELPQARISQGD